MDVDVWDKAQPFHVEHVRLEMFLLIVVAFSLASYALSSPNLTTQWHPCSSIIKRQEWRALSSSQKKEYIHAVQCLQRLPAVTTFTAVKTRFDDFQALHINLTDQVHLVGQFLPWHRRFLGAYESALRRECDYKGANPYWDWTKDVADPESLLHSPVFDPSTGFGGPGTGAGGAVIEGPFASYNLSRGPGQMVSNHRLIRQFNHTMIAYLTSAQVSNTTKQPTFEQFRVELEGAPVTPTIKLHDAGHRLIGGDMGNTYSSPGDPLFYLHHANLDRIWWQWQQMGAPKRLYEVSGHTSVYPPYKTVTLDFKLEMGILAPLVPIRDVMNIAGGCLCYQYV